MHPNNHPVSLPPSAVAVAAALPLRRRRKLPAPRVPLWDPTLCTTTLDDVIESLDDGDGDDRVLGCLPRLLDVVAFRRRLAKALENGRAVVAALRRGRPLPDEVWDELRDVVPGVFEASFRSVLMMEWGSGSPMGGGGYSEIRRCGGVHWFVSSDWEDEGPFDSLDALLTSVESFANTVPPESSLTSDVLSPEELLVIAKRVYPWGDRVPLYVGGLEYVEGAAGELVWVDAP